MATTVHIPGSTSPIAVETVRVSLRRNGVGSWVAQPFLFCNYISFAAAPTMSDAEFEWRYGEGMRQGETSFSQIPFLHVENWLVKVEVDLLDEYGDPSGVVLTWVGIIVEVGDNVLGSLGGQPNGIAKLLAYGPEWLLDRIHVTKMYFSLDDDEAVTYASEPFNKDIRIQGNQADHISKKEHKHRVGNRSFLDGEKGVYVFAGNSDYEDGLSEQWSVKDIADYLLAYFPPQDVLDDPIAKFELDPIAIVYLPEGGIQEVISQGKTVKQILDEVIDRRRLLSYIVEATDDDEIFNVRPFTYLDEDIILDDEDLTIWANADGIDLIVDDAANVDQLHLKKSVQQQYTQVIALGAPMIACGTYSYDAVTNLSLDRMWTDADKTKYDRAAIDSAGYNGLEEFMKIHRNEAARAKESLSHVYTAFGISRKNTSFWAGDFYSGELLTNPILWSYYDAIRGSNVRLGVVPTPVEAFTYQPALKLATQLPLRSCHDYSADKIAQNAVLDNTPDGGQWHYLEPLVIINTKDPDKAIDWFENVAETGRQAQVETMHHGMGLTFGCNVHIPVDANYFQLRVEGDHQHFLGKDDYPANPGLGYEEEPPLYSWKNDMLATLAVVLPPIAEVWPIIPDFDPENQLCDTLIIDASDWAALHYVAPNTVVAVEDGQLVRTTAGGAIRDDRAFLRRIARLAYGWYSTPRKAMTLTYRGATPVCRVGDLIETLGTGATSEEINTVVTQIRIDFAQSAEEPHKTTLHTQWAELDVLRMIL